MMNFNKRADKCPNPAGDFNHAGDAHMQVLEKAYSIQIETFGKLYDRLVDIAGSKAPIKAFLAMESDMRKYQRKAIKEMLRLDNGSSVIPASMLRDWTLKRKRLGVVNLSLHFELMHFSYDADRSLDIIERMADEAARLNASMFSGLVEYLSEAGIKANPGIELEFNNKKEALEAEAEIIEAGIKDA